MTANIKTFDELTTRELYEILRLRSAVFIVEQGGRYQDLDGIDYHSVHIFYENEQQEVLGCIRVFPKEDEPGTVQLGRLVTRDRKTGLGSRLMADAIRIARERFGAKEVYLTGRASALGFYEKCGFRSECGELMAETVPYHKLRRSI